MQSSSRCVAVMALAALRCVAEMRAAAAEFSSGVFSGRSPPLPSSRCFPLSLAQLSSAPSSSQLHGDGDGSRAMSAAEPKALSLTSLDEGQ